MPGFRAIPGRLGFSCGSGQDVLEFQALLDVQRPFVREGKIKLTSLLKGEKHQILSICLEPLIDLTLDYLELDLELEVGPEDKIMVNGYQSWTTSREFSPNESMGKLKWPGSMLLSPYGDYQFRKYSGKRGQFHSWTYSYLRRSDGTVVLFGSLNEKSGYTVFEFDAAVGYGAGARSRLKVTKDVKGLRPEGTYEVLRLFIGEGPENEVFDAYFDLMQLPARKRLKPLTGWTSWYNYYTKVSEQIVLNNLKAFAERQIPIDVFQIDDGWESRVGDWLEANSKFPRGMKFLADEIKKGGYIPGLWLAPFVCEKPSKVFHCHPEWLLRDSSGAPVKAGFNPTWSGWFYALDIYNQGFRDYLARVFDLVLGDWGFDMVKLDFLYAAALFPSEGRARGQVMCEAMEFLRQLVGDKMILGCGVPLGPSFGLVDMCRIGSDVALMWEDRLLEAIGYRERVSTVNSLRSTIGRRHLNGRVFLNDPDVIILRSVNQKQAPEQRRTLLILNLMLGGVILTSDNPDEYLPDELSTYLSMFPFKEKEIVNLQDMGDWLTARFIIDGREYVAAANLSSKAKRFELENGVYFESGKGFIKCEGVLELPPYSTRIFLVVPSGVQEEGFSVAGSTGHIFPGCEVSEFSVKDGCVSLKVHPDFRNRGEIYLMLPNGLRGAHVNGRFVGAKEFGDFMYLAVDASSLGSNA